MVEKAVHRLLKRRHFWRTADFDELSEIYISMMFRSLSISMSGIFIPIYLLKLQYGVVDVLCYFAWYYAFRAFGFDFVAGCVTARIGPKHTMLASYVLSIASTAQFLTLSHFHWPIWMLGGLAGIAASMFWIPYHTNLSQINHREHGGKELAYVSIVTKAGGVIGPVVGGLTATLFGGQYIFLAAVIVQLMGAIPLLFTAEAVQYRQRLDFSSFRLHTVKVNVISYVSQGVEQVISALLWPLYLGAYILVSKAAYAKLGFLASISVIAAMLSAYTIGKLVDKSQGRTLLRAGTIVNAFVHLLRPFVGSYGAAFALNTANEGISVTYQLPYSKGVYNAADDMPKHRISFFIALESFSSLARCSFWVLLILLTLLIAERDVMRVGFIMGAITSLLIMTERFNALSSK